MKYVTPRLRAKAAGLKRYVGLPCINCGGTTRLVSSQECVVCKQAKKQAQRKKKQKYTKPGRPKNTNPKPVLTTEELEQLRQKKREYDRAYRAKPERQGYKRAKKAKYRCDVLNRTPKWLTKQDKIAIRAIYDAAVTKSNETGEVYHVDHIIPLRGKLVSGLHVPSNLQILTAEENLKKLAQYAI